MMDVQRHEQPGGGQQDTTEVEPVSESGTQVGDQKEGEGEYSDRSRYPVPGLITLDLTMPHGDGFSLLQRLKSNPEWAGIRAVVLTGSAYPEDIQKAYQLGACAYHVKPGAYEDLEKLLKTMFDYWLTSEVARAVIAGEQVKTDIRPQPGQKSDQPQDRRV